MISSADYPTLFTFEKNLASDNTYTGLVKKHQVSAQAFDATKGLGQNSANSTTLTMFAAPISGDMRVTFRGQYGNTTTTANSNFGLFLRMQDTEDITADPDLDQNGYYIRVQNGNARISLYNGNTLTNLASGALACLADEVVEIIVTFTGDLITATFENITANPGTVVTLTATDSTYSYGFSAWRSLAATVWCRYIKAEQL